MSSSLSAYSYLYLASHVSISWIFLLRASLSLMISWFSEAIWVSNFCTIVILDCWMVSLIDLFSSINCWMLLLRLLHSSTFPLSTKLSLSISAVNVVILFSYSFSLLEALYRSRTRLFRLSFSWIMILDRFLSSCASWLTLLAWTLEACWAFVSSDAKWLFSAVTLDSLSWSSFRLLFNKSTSCSLCWLSVSSLIFWSSSWLNFSFSWDSLTTFDSCSLNLLLKSENSLIRLLSYSFSPRNMPYFSSSLLKLSFYALRLLHDCLTASNYLWSCWTASFDLDWSCSCWRIEPFSFLKFTIMTFRFSISVLNWVIETLYCVNSCISLLKLSFYSLILLRLFR